MIYFTCGKCNKTIYALSENNDDDKDNETAKVICPECFKRLEDRLDYLIANGKSGIL
jgi:DNA-directed RNA polymerase subunit RPC12/RpoP